MPDNRHGAPPRAAWMRMAGHAGAMLMATGACVAVAQDVPALLDHSAMGPPRAVPGPNQPISAQSQAIGADVFKGNCTACHDGGVNRAPPTATLRTMAPDAILRALTVGAMKAQASALSPAQKLAVAEFVAQRRLGSDGAAAAPAMCGGKAAWFDRSAPPQLAGWGFDAANSHAIPGAVAGLDRANVGRLKLKWALAFPNAINARSQPMPAGGALFVGGENGTVHALDPKTGCAHWTFAATGPVRTGIVVAPWRAGDKSAAPQLYFGDMSGRAYALDAATGKLLWQKLMDGHESAILTGTPTLHGDRLYVPVSSWEETHAANAQRPCCTFRGSLVALDSGTGAEIWRTFMVPEPKLLGKNKRGVAQYGPSGVAIWSAPLVDATRGLVFVTTGDNYSSPATALSDAFIALDMKTGAIKWVHQALAGDSFNLSCIIDAGHCPEEDGPDFDFGAAPLLATGSNGKAYLVGGQKSGMVYALDPATGAVRWTQRAGRGGVLGGIHFGIAASGDTVFVPVSDFPDGRSYSEPAKPGIHALDLTNGKPRWSNRDDDVCNGKPQCAPGYSGAISVTDQLVLAGSTDGHLRILDSTTGDLLWEADTNQTYETVDGSIAHGGSMSGGSAPIAWHGMVFVNSGYGALGKMPGNVLLAFGVD